MAIKERKKTNKIDWNKFKKKKTIGRVYLDMIIKNI